MSTSKKIVSDQNLPTEASESLGAWLARTRVSLGAEPRDMARHLGLNPSIILALEADDFTRLGPPVFVRGYLSRYARWLDLPEATVLERYRQQSGPSQEPPPLKVVHSRRRQSRMRDLRGFAYLLVVIGLGWAAIQHLGDLDPGRLLTWWPRDQQTHPASKPMAATTQTQYPFQAKPEEATEPASPPAPAVSEPPTAPSPEPASTTASAITQAPPVAAEPVSTPTGAVSPAPTLAATTPEENGDSSALDTRSGARLMLQFSEDCWVQVKDAQGKILVNGLMKANTTHDLSGPAPFTVTLGNAPAARIALDDRPVDTAIYVPRRGTVSRFTLNSQP